MRRYRGSLSEDLDPWGHWSHQKHVLASCFLSVFYINAALHQKKTRKYGGFSLGAKLTTADKIAWPKEQQSRNEMQSHNGTGQRCEVTSQTSAVLQQHLYCYICS